MSICTLFFHQLFYFYKTCSLGFLLTRNLIISSIYICMQEIMKNEKCREEIQMKSQDFYEKEKLLQEAINLGN